MKKILALVILLASFGLAQKQIEGFSIVQDLGTQANSAQETCYLDLRGWTSVDSVVVSLAVSNETDVDTINFYGGVYTNDGFIDDAAAGVLYQAVTLNVADGATDVEPLATSGATKLTGAAIRGFNGIKAVIEVAGAGNDATDPNALYILWRVFGTK